MPTRTTYTVTTDGETTSYPDDSTGWPDGGESNNLRYSAIGASEQTFAYPSSNDSGFTTPTLRFKFLDAYAKNIPKSPIVNLRMPSSFNVTSFSDYARTENIFGTGTTVTSGGSTDAFSTAIASVLGPSAAATLTEFGIKITEGFATVEQAAQYRLATGAARALGFATSAGLNNTNQYEFANRMAINPMAQLLYRGPQFRRYQIPFILRAKNSTESRNIKKIISIFRVASSPSVPASVRPYLTNLTFTNSDSAGVNFVFSYPHLTQFSIWHMNVEATASSTDELVGKIPSESAVKRIFRSFPCVIESVGIDYGGQKMTLFEDGNPTEINMTLQLSEITPRTMGDAITDATDQNIKIS